MNKQEILSVLSELYKITGFRMSLHDTNFKEIAAYPEEKLPFCKYIHDDKNEYATCVECDKAAFSKVLETKEPYIYRCRYGLTEAVSPLYNFGVLTGFIMMGQAGCEQTDYEVLKAALKRIGIEGPEAQKISENVPKISKDMTLSYTNIMTICARYLTLSNAMQKATPGIAEAAMLFIQEEYDKKIALSDICRAIGCSKSSLLVAFKREFGITVNTAITRRRLECAKKMLSDRSMSISDVAAATGFYDQSYFSKVFSREYGISPSDFRKENTAK